jgi:thiamine-phosphate pyrophosphorylase
MDGDRLTAVSRQVSPIPGCVLSTGHAFDRFRLHRRTGKALGGTRSATQSEYFAEMSRDPALPPAQLYLMTPPISDADGFAPLLDAMLSESDVASVMLRVVASDDSVAKKIIKTIAPVVQRHGAALLVEGWAAVVARAGADGVHLVDQRQGLADAVESLKPERIVGVGGVRSKHDAMVLAESGADYVMVGEPARDGRPPPLDAVVERTGWWAELFELPCVAYAPDLAAVPLLADAGADFVAVGEAVFGNAAGPVEGLRLASRLLAQRAP